MKRVIIRAPNWLGDAVMALPAIGSLRRALPDATLIVGAIPSVAPIFREITSAAPDDVIVVPDGGREADLLRQGLFDGVILLPNSFRSAWSARRAGIPERWGYSGNLRGWMLTRPIARPAERLHQATYYLELVRRLGFTPSEELPHVSVRGETRMRADRLLEEAGVRAGAPLVGFAPGAAYGHAKRWPPQRVAQVVIRLTRQTRVVCVLMGASGDRDAGREIESSLPPDVRIVNLIGRTDLRVFAGVLTRLSAFASNDSGGMHLAAALGVPVTAIFGPTDERVTAPLGQQHDVLVHQVFCRPCMLRECPIDHRCMKRISADRVFEHVARHVEVRA